MTGASGGADDPVDVADRILSLARPVHVVFDCDGVLAPLTDHADDSVLLDGDHPLLTRLTELGGSHGIHPAILSGRSLEGLAQFDFPEGLLVLGSYGGERSDRDTDPLDEEEAQRLAALDEAARSALDVAGEGAWIERKPASVVLHVRQADAERGAAALVRLAELQAAVPGSSAHDGSQVLEVLARANDKGSALRRLRTEEAAASLVYLGDDVPDEDAFAELGDGDLGIKIGPGDTAASRRLADPEAVRDLLTALVDRLAG